MSQPLEPGAAMSELRERIAQAIMAEDLLQDDRAKNEPDYCSVDARVDAVMSVLASWQSLMAILDEHYPPEVFDGSSGDEGPRIVALLRAVDAERSSRQAWAEEAMRLEMELAKLREVALDVNTFWSVILVGIGGEHEEPPSNEQVERTVGLWLRHVDRELHRPNWHPRATCGRGDACDQHGAFFRHADGQPCWGCQICLEDEGDDCACVSDEQAAQLGPGFSRPVCAVHPEVTE